MADKSAIIVRKAGAGAYDVSVKDGGGETRHRVTFPDAEVVRLTGGRHTAEQCLEAAFRFLLDREPKESILRSFDISVIARYFPEFERMLPTYLGGTK